MKRLELRYNFEFVFYNIMKKYFHITITKILNLVVGNYLKINK